MSGKRTKLLRWAFRHAPPKIERTRMHVITRMLNGKWGQSKEKLQVGRPGWRAMKQAWNAFPRTLRRKFRGLAPEYWWPCLNPHIPA